MKRRAYLTATGLAVTTTLAGCSSSDSGPDPKLGTVSENGLELTVRVEDPQYASHVEFDVGDKGITKASVSKESPKAAYTIGSPETLGTEQQQLKHETEIEITLFGQDGALAAQTDWKFEPELQLTDIVHSTEFEYTPENHAQETTPLLEVSNTGSGPAKIGELVIFNISQNTPLKGSNDETGFAKAVIAREPTGGRLSPVETREANPFLIPGGESAYFAANGLFTHTGEPPEAVQSTKQRFDVEIRWAFGDLQHTVTAELSGGISKTDTETYRFSEYEIDDIEATSPLK